MPSALKKPRQPTKKHPPRTKRKRPSTAAEWTPTRSSQERKFRWRSEAEREADLDRGIENWLGRNHTHYSPEDWRSLREQFRLNLLYQNSFVAFRDHYLGEGDSRRLLRREVLISADNLVKVSRFVSKLSPEEICGVYIDHIEPQ